MIATIHYVLALLVVVRLSTTQNAFKPSLTCYRKYHHEETRSPQIEKYLSYSYSQSEITQYVTPDGELCANVGCSCFSYRAACSPMTPSTKSNHYSQCTDADRQTGEVKWHLGWTSNAQCETMRRQPNVYRDLTCCQTDRCNNQPGKVTHMVEPNLPIQPYETYFKPASPSPVLAYAPARQAATTPAYVTYRTSRRYDHHPHGTGTTVAPVDKSNEAFDKAQPQSQSVVSSASSMPMLALALMLVSLCLPMF